MKLKLFTLAIILINYSTMIIAEQSFYSGTIVGAQYSKVKPKIKNLDYYESLVGKEKITRKSIKNTKSRDLAYLAISVKMEVGRTLSTHDYFVMGDGMPFACAAIQIGALPFDASYQEIDIENPEKVYTLLFVVDSWFKMYKFQLIFRHAFEGTDQKKIIVKAKRLRGALANLSGEKPPVAEVAKPAPVIVKPVVAEVAKPAPVIVKPVVVKPVKVELLDINKATTQQLKDIGVSGFIANEIVSRRSKGQYSDMKNLLERFNDASSCKPALKKLDGKIIFNAIINKNSSSDNVAGKLNINNYPTRKEAKLLNIPYYLIGEFIRYMKKENKKFSSFDEFIKAKSEYEIERLKKRKIEKNEDEEWLNSRLRNAKRANDKIKKEKDKFIFE